MDCPGEFSSTSYEKLFDECKQMNTIADLRSETAFVLGDCNNRIFNNNYGQTCFSVTVSHGEQNSIGTIGIIMFINENELKTCEYTLHTKHSMACTLVLCPW